MPTRDEFPSFSRSGISGPFGKCDRSLEISMSEALEERLIAMAALNGMPKGTYARRLIERVIFGEFFIAQSMARGGANLNPDNSRDFPE